VAAFCCDARCYNYFVILSLGVSPMRRREFIMLLGSGVAGWPLAALAQQRAMPVVGWLAIGTSAGYASFANAFGKGLNELTVAFQAEQGGVGFQIYSAPIDGNVITQERLLRDEASGVSNDPVHTTVAGVPGLAFHGFDAAMGQTYEVWLSTIISSSKSRRTRSSNPGSIRYWPLGASLSNSHVTHISESASDNVA
jgi:hypothetical protein